MIRNRYLVFCRPNVLVQGSFINMIRNKYLVFCRPNVLVQDNFINICQAEKEKRCLLTIKFSFDSVRGRLQTLTIFYKT